MVEILFTLEQLLRATGGRAQNVAAAGISGVSIDSRALKVGALFVAIRGANFDGHDFVPAAIENGAAMALVCEQRAASLAGLPLIVVRDPLKGMEGIARAARARSGARIAAITGSAGKTTVRGMVEAILRETGETHASIRSYNNHWGVPLMLANMAETARFGVFEIGMNHAGEITPLVGMVRPHVALITSIGPAHLGNFDDMEGIARAKGEIFSGLEPGGVAIVNADHDHGEILREAARIQSVTKFLTYGFSPDADIVIRDFAAGAHGGSAHISLEGRRLEIELGVSGAHMMANGVGALLAARELGGDVARALEVLARLEAPEGRGTVEQLGKSPDFLILVDESYNANPASMRAALEVFGARKVGRGRRVLVLGDMLELGKRSAELHEELLAGLGEESADVIFLVGEQLEKASRKVQISGLAHRARHIEDIKDIIVNSLASGDLVMVKGSNGVGLSSLVAEIRRRFAGASQADYS